MFQIFRVGRKLQTSKQLSDKWWQKDPSYRRVSVLQLLSCSDNEAFCIECTQALPSLSFLIPPLSFFSCWITHTVNIIQEPLGYTQLQPCNIIINGQQWKPIAVLIHNTLLFFSECPCTYYNTFITLPGIGTMHCANPDRRRCIDGKCHCVADPDAP